MPVVTHSSKYAAPVEFVFAYVSDYRNVPKFTLGLERFDPRGEQIRGVGADFDSRVDVGPMKLDVLVEAVRWVENEDITLQCTHKLLDAKIDFRARRHKSGGTAMTVVGDYSVGGGLAGKILDKALVIFVKLAIIHLDRSLHRQVDAAYSASSRSAE